MTFVKLWNLRQTRISYLSALCSSCSSTVYLLTIATVPNLRPRAIATIDGNREFGLDLQTTALDCRSYAAGEPALTRRMESVGSQLVLLRPWQRRYLVPYLQAKKGAVRWRSAT